MGPVEVEPSQAPAEPTAEPVSLPIIDRSSGPRGAWTNDDAYLPGFEPDEDEPDGDDTPQGG